MIKKQILKLSDSGTKTIKFVDRTFNCDLKRAYEILEYIISLNTDCCFHFEAAADLFDERILFLLSKAPPGRVQLEIGLQSFYGPALEAVSRKSDLIKSEKNIKILIAMRNIHVHLDLIAGLPFESLLIFKNSFNRAYDLGAHNLQLGFLKLLHGSKLRDQAENLGIIYNKNPPYEIISSSWLSENDLNILKKAENSLQNTYNKSRFLCVLKYILEISGLSAFDLYRGLGEAVSNHDKSLEIYAEQIYNYFININGADKYKLQDFMICDFLSMTKGKSMPDFLKYNFKNKKQAILKAKKYLGRAIDFDEVAVLSSGEIVFINGFDKNPVTGLYKLYFLNI